MTFFPCNTGVHIAQIPHSAENIHTDKALKETSLADNGCFEGSTSFVTGFSG